MSDYDILVLTDVQETITCLKDAEERLSEFVKRSHGAAHAMALFAVAHARHSLIAAQQIPGLITDANPTLANLPITDQDLPLFEGGAK